MASSLFGQSRKNKGSQLLPGGRQPINLSDILKPSYQHFGTPEGYDEVETLQDFTPELTEEFPIRQQYGMIRGEYDNPISNTRRSEAQLSGNQESGAFGLGQGVGTKSELAKGRSMAAAAQGQGQATHGGAEPVSGGVGGGQSGQGKTPGGGQLQGTFEERLQDFLMEQGQDHGIDLAKELYDTFWGDQTFDRGTSEQAYQDQRAGERADFSAGATGGSAASGIDYTQKLLDLGLDPSLANELGEIGVGLFDQATLNAAPTGETVDIGSGAFDSIMSRLEGALGGGAAGAASAASPFITTPASQIYEMGGNVIGNLGSTAATSGTQAATSTASTTAGSAQPLLSGNYANIAAAAVPALVGWGVTELTGDPVAGQTAGYMAGFIAAMMIAGSNPAGVALAAAAVPIMAWMQHDAQESPYAQSRKKAGRGLKELGSTTLPYTMYNVGMATTPEELNTALTPLAGLTEQGDNRLQMGGLDAQGHVVDPRQVRLSGGYETGAEVLPEINETLQRSIEMRLQLMDEAAKGNKAAQAMLQYTKEGSSRAMNQWIDSNMDAYQKYRVAPMVQAHDALGVRAQEMGKNWATTDQGQVWGGTPEQLGEYNQLMDEYNKFDYESLVPGKLLGDTLTAEAEGRQVGRPVNPMEIYGWDTFLQDNPEWGPQLEEYMGQIQQPTESASGMDFDPTSPDFDVNSLSPEQLDMYRRWLGSGAGNEDDELMRMLMMGGI